MYYLKNTKILFRLIRKVLKLAGYDVFIRKDRYVYVPEIKANLRYKLHDPRENADFVNVADEVVHAKTTTLYYDRLSTLFEALRDLSRRYKQLNIAEIGVYNGGGSFFLASVVKKLSLTGRIYSIDTFEGHSEKDLPNGKEGKHTTENFQNTSFDTVSRYLGRFNFVKVFKGRIQDVANQFSGLKFHFIHLDVDIYAPTIFALKFFGERMVLGGIIVIDDYRAASCPGIEKAINEFLSTRTDFAKVGLLSEQCLLMKL